jgi:anti-anti-sigma regulatory factor
VIIEDKSFTITIEPSPFIPNLTIITLEGSLDLSISKYVDEKVLPILEKGESNIILDLSHLKY